MPKCCVKGCGSKYNKKNKKKNNKNSRLISLHKLPNSEKLKKKWLESLGQENIDMSQKIMFVCSLHFEESCINRTLELVRLFDNAVPTKLPKVHQEKFIKTEGLIAVSKNNCVFRLETGQPATSTKVHNEQLKITSLIDGRDESENISMTNPETSIFGISMDNPAFRILHRLRNKCLQQRNKIKRLNEKCRRQSKKLANFRNILQNVEKRKSNNEGTFENPLGTYMFFEEDSLAESEDPLFDRLPEKNLKFLEKTRKLISIEHAYVTPKEKQEPGHEEEVQKTSSDIQPADFKNIQDALEKFKKEWKNKIVNK